METITEVSRIMLEEVVWPMNRSKEEMELGISRVEFDLLVLRVVELEKIISHLQASYGVDSNDCKINDEDAKNSQVANGFLYRGKPDVDV